MKSTITQWLLDLLFSSCFLFQVPRMGCYSLLCGVPDHASPFLKSLGWFLISFCIHSSSSPHTSKPVTSRLWIISFPSSASSVPSLHSLSIHFMFLLVAPSLWTHNIRLLSHHPSTIVYLDSFLNKLSFFPSVLNNSWNPILCKSHFELSKELPMVSSSCALTLMNLPWLLPLISTPITNSPLLPTSMSPLPLTYV